MAINIDKFELPITAQETRDYLQRNTDNFGVFFDVDRIYELSALLQLEMLDVTRKARRLSLNPKLMLDDKNGVINTLLKMGVSKAEFYVNEGGKKSREMKYTADIRKSIAESGMYSPEVVEFVKINDIYVSNKRNKGYIENLANRQPQSRALSKLNHRMAVGRPTWSILNTSRIAADNPGVQGVPRTMGDIICEPKGYTLVRCDSGQIEPRINFSTFLRDELIMNLIIYYDDAYFGLLNYCNMHNDEEQLCRADFQSNFKPMEITDSIKDMRQNIKRLTNAGSYGSANLGNINPQLAQLYEMKIVKHPARKALEASVREAVNHGEDTFYGFFGTPVTPQETEKYKKGEDGWNEHVIRCGINNPIQTTASELMMFSVNKAREILSRAKDSHVCFYKHDEACFYVSDEDMANGIGDELADITAYNVKGWIPIHADPMFGIKPGEYPSYIL